MEHVARIGKDKVKCTLVQALRLCTGRTAHRGSRGIALLFLNRGSGMGVRGQQHDPGRSLHEEKTRYSLYTRLDGARGQSGQVRKICLHRDSIPGPSSS